MHDKEIQQLLGFYSLCSYINNKISTAQNYSVCLRVCPVLFAVYLKGRCRAEQSLQVYLDGNIQRSACVESINQTESVWNEHARVCNSYPLNKGSELLRVALELHCRAITLRAYSK